MQVFKSIAISMGLMLKIKTLKIVKEMKAIGLDVDANKIC